MRSSLNESQTQILESISIEFEKHRTGKGGHFPKPLKQLILSGIESGISKTGLARASGLSKATVLLWSRNFEPSPIVPPSVRELQLIDADRLIEESNPSSRKLICVRLRFWRRD
jgi:hypothetical protein